SISGMRVLRYLRERRGSRISIWPFDEVSDTGSAIVEVFPRYFALSKGLSPKMSDHSALNDALIAFDSDPVEFSPSSEDEGDALIIAAALRCLSKDPTRFALPGAEIREEGWIFGVPLTPPVVIDLKDEQIAEIELRPSDDQPIA